MEYGHTGRILRVDLSNGTVSAEEHDDVFYRRYWGGVTMIAYYLLRDVAPT